MADLPLRYEAFLDEFRNVDIVRLDAAFQLARGNCTEFPTPGDVRKCLTEPEVQKEQLGAELAWNRFKLRYKHWYPDVGLSSSAPEQDQAGEHAERQIGGFRRFNASELDHEGFVRKEFIAAYMRYCETGGLLAPSRQEAAALLGKLRTALDAQKDSATDSPVPAPPLTKEGHEARMAELRKQAEQLMKGT